MFECEGKDARGESMLLVTAVLYLALATFHSLRLFLSAHLPVLFQHDRSVSLIVTPSVLITHPSAHCLGSRGFTKARLSFEENIALRRINIKLESKDCHSSGFKKYSPFNATKERSS